MGHLDNAPVIMPYKPLPLLCRLSFHQWVPYTGIVPWSSGIPDGSGAGGSKHWAIWYEHRYCYRHEPEPLTNVSATIIENRARKANASISIRLPSKPC